MGRGAREGQKVVCYSNKWAAVRMQLPIISGRVSGDDVTMAAALIPGLGAGVEDLVSVALQAALLWMLSLRSPLLWRVTVCVFPLTT